MVFQYAGFWYLYLVLFHVQFLSVMIQYLTYVGTRWIGGGPVSLETSWTCVFGREDVLFVFISSLMLYSVD